MVRPEGFEVAVNLPESERLYKRRASNARGVSEGLTDIAAIIAPGASFVLAGPSEKLDPAHLPVRGDLAHIRLAGKVFVPHYVVPMPHQVTEGGAAVRSAARDDAEIVAELPAGAAFQVLDVAGVWAWGQAGEAEADTGGAVGYVLAAALRPGA